MPAAADVRFETTFGALPRIDPKKLTRGDALKINAFMRRNAPLIVDARIRVERKLERELLDKTFDIARDVSNKMNRDGTWDRFADQAADIASGIWLKDRKTSFNRNRLRDFLQSSDALQVGVDKAIERSVGKHPFAELNGIVDKALILFIESAVKFVRAQLALIPEALVSEAIQKQAASGFTTADLTFIDLVFRHPPTQMQTAITQRFNEITVVNLDDVMFTDFKQSIFTDFHENATGALGAREVARNIKKNIVDKYNLKLPPTGFKKGSQQRVELWARTEGAVIQNDTLMHIGRDAGMSGKLWQTAGDSRVRDAHSGNEGDGVIPMNDLFSDGSFDAGSGSQSPFNCFHPSQRIQGHYIGASRVLYDGEMLRIETRKGNVIRCTPNHPILTDTGFKFACLLCKSDNLVCGPAHVTCGEGLVPWQQNEDNVHVTIEQEFQSLLEIGSLFGHDVTPLDFYNDGEFCQGKVDVVCSKGSLIRKLDAASREQVFEHQLPFTSKSIMRPSHLALDKIRRISHALPFDALCFRRASNSNSLFSKAMINNTSTALEEFGERVDAELVSRVEDRNSFSTDACISASPWNANPLFSERAVNDPLVALELLCKLHSRFSSSVFVDDIVSIDHESYSGYVYDVESSTGLMIADNGIICKQCRCSGGPAMLHTRLPTKRERDILSEIATRVPTPVGFLTPTVITKPPAVAPKKPVIPKEQPSISESPKELRAEKPGEPTPPIRYEVPKFRSKNEAAKWIEENKLSKKALFTSGDTAGAQQVANGMAEVMSRFGLADGTLTYVGPPTKAPQWSRNRPRRMQRGAAASHFTDLSVSEYGRTLPEFQELLLSHNSLKSKRFAEMWNNGNAAFAKHHNLVDDVVRDIEVRMQFRAGVPIPNADELIKRAKRHTSRVTTSTGTESTIEHEMGHNLHIMHPEADALLRRSQKALDEKWGRLLSEYGASNKREYAAEATVSYLRGEVDRIHPDVLDWFKSHDTGISAVVPKG